MEKARKEGNIDQMAQYFSSDCTYRLSATKQDGTKKEVAGTCQEYVDKERETISRTVSAGIQRSVLAIIRTVSRIGGNTKAVVYVCFTGYRVPEEAEPEPGDTFDSATFNTLENLTLQSRDGKTMITAVDMKLTDVHSGNRSIQFQ